MSQPLCGWKSERIWYICNIIFVDVYFCCRDKWFHTVFSNIQKSSEHFLHGSVIQGKKVNPSNNVPIFHQFLFTRDPVHIMLEQASSVRTYYTFAPVSHIHEIKEANKNCAHPWIMIMRDHHASCENLSFFYAFT